MDLPVFCILEAHPQNIDYGLHLHSKDNVFIIRRKIILTFQSW